MNSSMPASTYEEEWMNVGNYSSLGDALDHGLVILAMGEAIRVEKSASTDEFELQAEVSNVDVIERELAAYQQETDLVALPKREIDFHSAGYALTAVWILTLLGVFYWQSENSTLADTAANSSIGVFRKGEWWRPFTALFLHTDIPHLAGNLAGGSIFATLVARLIGSLRAWSWILICGTVGNFITAGLKYPEVFLSIGASTAVFAALGLLSGIGISENLRERSHLPWARIAAPVVAGIVLLSWLGGGSPGSNTDVVGHLCGFSAGLVAGVGVGMNLARTTGSRNLVNQQNASTR